MHVGRMPDKNRGPTGASLKIVGNDDDYFIKNMAGSIEIDFDDGDVERSGCKGMLTTQYQVAQPHALTLFHGTPKPTPLGHYTG